MKSDQDYRIRDLGRTRITLRDDLLFTPRRDGGTVFYVVEDPVRARFYRVGLAEYTFLSMLDVLAASGTQQPVRMEENLQCCPACRCASLPSRK